MALLLAGLATSVPGVSVNRLCGSGLEAVVQASRELVAGDADVVNRGRRRVDDARTVGDAQARSRFPREKPPCSRPRSAAHGEPADEPAVDGLTGEGAEILADEFQITREQQDAFALASHQKAARAWTPRTSSARSWRGGIELERDECVRADSTLERWRASSRSFGPNGTVSAGNSSPMNDGAAALLLMSERGLAMTDASPMARVASRAVSALEPHRYGLGPVEASSRALVSRGHHVG